MAANKAFKYCVDISLTCPVEATVYGYYPSLGGNITLCIIFSILCLSHIPLMIRYKLWTYSTFVGIGCFGEAVGYVGRIVMNDNPWNKVGFKMQLICLVIAPSFIAAGIYLTIKHLILHYGPEYSRLRPKLFTWIFISCDVLSIVVQSIGGVMAATADTMEKAKRGNNIVIAGIAIQVVTMGFCNLLAIDYIFRYRRGTKHVRASALGKRWSRPDVFCITSGFAFIFILIRCIYRLPEMASGWGGELMRNEVEFMILDGV
jgi:membrane protein YdbS with pleckstrin-like domain